MTQKELTLDQRPMPFKIPPKKSPLLPFGKRGEGEFRWGMPCIQNQLSFDIQYRKSFGRVIPVYAGTTGQ